MKASGGPFMEDKYKNYTLFWPDMLMQRENSTLHLFPYLL